MPDTPRSSSSHHVSGLQREATIQFDAAGVPHIRAASAGDAYFAQGFAAARDRLWQLDLWRKRGLGLLAADLGPGYLAQDRAARLFLYRGDMQQEWSAYGTQDTQAIVTAFVNGVNAFVDLSLQDPDLLPQEFKVLGTLPARWTPEDLVRIRSHALGRNVPSEVARALMLKAGGDGAADLLRRALEPEHPPVLPEGLDVDDLTPEVLQSFLLATVPVSFSDERLTATLAQAERWSQVDGAGEVVRNANAEGSNNWAVAPSRTGTGRALLASDPHRAYQAPSMRYVVHLKAPGLNVIGAGEPMLPGVSLGHNEHVAFSLTTFPMDQEDLHVYELHPDHDDFFRYGHAWERMVTIEQEFEVRGEAAQTRTLQFTRHGPVIHVDLARRRAYAVRTVWSEPGTAAYLGSLAYQDCTTVLEFGASLDHWSVPANNHVVADVQGHIGWFTAGKAPVRKGWDGLLPVPGDGRYEWRGFYPRTLLPSRCDPEHGFLYSANEMNLPHGRARGLGLAYEWAESFRAQRIREVLASRSTQSLQDARQLQSDTLSLPARRLCALLAPLASDEVDTRMGLNLLREWDHRLEADSAAALLFETWWMLFLRPAVLAAGAATDEIRRLMGPGDLETVLQRVERPDDAATRDACLLTTLSSAVRHCATRWGKDAKQWRWDTQHHGYFPHPLSSLGGARRADGKLDIGPVPIGGSGATVMNTQYRITDGRATVGASFRMVLDVGAWDRCVFVNAPGQSGAQATAGYRDHVEAWAQGRYFPLLFTDAAIDADTQHTIRLVPASAQRTES